jgi:acetylornithine deacetylase
MNPELTQLLHDLVCIDSVNPDLVPGGAGEAQIARFIATWLERRGLDVTLEAIIPGRPNVVATARGTGGGKTLLLNGHLDTVGAAGMQCPFEAFVDNGRLRGRGAYDMKGGLAACMAAIALARERRLRGNVIFTGVIDEEFASLGTAALAGRIPADGAIVAEFTEMRLITAHRGFAWMEIETDGVAAHGSRPDLGVDAITRMGPVLAGLDMLNRKLLANPVHPRLGSGSLHASIIEGGSELSTYPARCKLSYERRTIPGETPEQVFSEAQEILDRLAEDDPSFRASARQTLVRPPMETPPTAGILRVVQQAAEAVLGYPPEEASVPFWTDAALLADAGVPSVLFGPSGSGAHADEEWVDLESVERCASVYLEIAIRFCKGD